MDNDVVRISLLGGSGRGKTTFISGIYQSLVSGTVSIGDNVYVSLEVVSVRESSNYFDSDSIGGALLAANSIDRQYYIDEYFPDPTETLNSTEFTFNLKINNVVCCKLVIADYAGEFIDHPPAAENENYARMCEQLANSDAIVIVADTVVIAEHYGNEHKIKNEIGANIVNSIYDVIMRITRRNHKSITTLIALTKTDHLKIPDAMKRSNFADISTYVTEKIYQKACVSISSDKLPFGVIPVSAVGENRTNEANLIIPDANIAQVNIDTAVLFCLYCSIQKIIDNKVTEIERINRENKFLVSIFSKKNKQEKQSNLVKLKNMNEELENLILARQAFNNNGTYFSEHINNMFDPYTSEIGSFSKI